MDLSAVVLSKHLLFEGLGMCAALQVVVAFGVVVSDLVCGAFALAFPHVVRNILTS